MSQAAAERFPRTAPNDAASNLEALWGRFADPRSPQEFYSAWLEILCLEIANTRSGLLLLRRDDRRFAPAAVWPTLHHDVKYLSVVAERALTEKQAIVHLTTDKDEGAQPGVVIGYPIDAGEQLHGVVVLDIAETPGPRMVDIMRSLHWGAGWIDGQIWRARAQEFDTKLERSATALDLLALGGQQDNFEGSAIAVANELAAKFECERVSIGVAHGHSIKLRAMSNSAWFSKRADVVSAIETAMQEALDQAANVAHPHAGAATPRQQAVAHRQLAERFGSQHVASIILPSRHGPFGVMTFERRATAFDAEALSTFELVASLVGPSLALKARSDRWVAGRIAEYLRQKAENLAGPNHTALKLGTGLALMLIAVFGFVRDDFRITAKSVLEGSVQRAAVSPFEGYIKEAQVRAGDVVQEGQVLAQLSDRDLKLDQLKWQSERDKLLQKQRDALAKHDRVGVLVAGAQLRQAEAQLSLATEKLQRTTIVAPISGIVVSGDLSQMLGAPVELGKVLYEIAPLDSYRVVLQVDEYDIGYIKPGQRGTMLLSGSADETIPLQINQVSSVSTPQDGRNYFRVEASIQDSKTGLRPGMEGVAKVVIDRRHSLWIWTRTSIDRLRFFMWHWLP